MAVTCPECRSGDLSRDDDYLGFWGAIKASIAGLILYFIAYYAALYGGWGDWWLTTGLPGAFVLFIGLYWFAALVTGLGKVLGYRWFACDICDHRTFSKPADASSF